MKNRTITFLFALIYSSQLFSQADTWTQITGNGFGLSPQVSVPEMEVYNGYLYAATAPAAGLAKLWRSSSGDIGTWTQIMNFSPPLSGDRSIHSFGTTELDGGYIWCGTGNSLKGTIIYRSQNGQSWTAISKRGFGNPLLSTASPHLVVFQGTGDTIPYLYAGAGSHGAGTPAQLWRTPYTNQDSSAWDLLIDFAGTDPDVTLVSYLYVWCDTLYFATDDSGQLWQSTDGINFTKNPYVGDGFGVPSNHVISSLAVFNDTLYATTTNMQGGQLWRSGNGVNWQMVTANAFGKGNAVNELRSLRTSFGKLWITGYTDTSLSDGTPVWRSDDGMNFVQSNSDGFGNSDNNGENAVVIGFGNYEYFGGPNYIEGGQVWRADMSTGIDNPLKTRYSVHITPNPFHEFAFITISPECPEIEQVIIYDQTGKLIRTVKVPDNRQIRINKGTISSGIYFYALQSLGGFIILGKFILE